MQYPVYSSQTRNGGLAGFYSEYLFEDAITWTTDGANAGDVNYRPGKFYCTNVCGVLKNEGGYANICVAELINCVSKSYVSYVGNPKLMNGVMASIRIPIPPLSEQKKISDCLSSIDALIAAEAGKLDAMKDHKRGLMQHLFPTPGEATPRLRFPEFQDAGEWEEKEVGDVFTVTRGNVLAMTLVEDVPTDRKPYPVYSSQTKRAGLAGYYSDFLYENAITWTTDGANAGDVNYRAGKFYCTNVCGVLISRDGYANSCVAAIINSVSKSHVSYVGNPKLMNGVMAKIVVPLPSVEEQAKIALCLSSADTLITAQGDKINILKAHKRGLMQQLFPVADEVQG